MTDRTMHWGLWYRRVCWLVRPSSFDAQIPDDHTIMYVLSHPAGLRNKYPVPFLETIDREEAERVSHEKHRTGEPHILSTHWYDSTGKRVKKFEVIARMRELRMIDEYESSGEFQLEQPKSSPRALPHVASWRKKDGRL